ncbi:MAG: hypothetical protein WAM67_11140 [Candidatus Acidiferrales bacterium]
MLLLLPGALVLLSPGLLLGALVLLVLVCSGLLLLLPLSFLALLLLLSALMLLVLLSSGLLLLLPLLFLALRLLLPLILFLLLAVLLLSFGLSLVLLLRGLGILPVLVVLCEQRSKGSKKKEQDSGTDKSDWFHERYLLLTAASRATHFHWCRY